MKTGDRLNALIGSLTADKMLEGKDFSRLDNVGFEIEQIKSQVAKEELLSDSSFT